MYGVEKVLSEDYTCEMHDLQSSNNVLKKGVNVDLFISLWSPYCNAFFVLQTKLL